MMNYEIKIIVRSFALYLFLISYIDKTFHPSSLLI